VQMLRNGPEMTHRPITSPTLLSPPLLSPQQVDYYKALGVPRTATAKQIKRKYHEMARKWHPGAALVLY
jgi:DnaJ-domain-containing protein 1